MCETPSRGLSGYHATPPERPLEIDRFVRRANTGPAINCRGKHPTNKITYVWRQSARIREKRGEKSPPSSQHRHGSERLEITSRERFEKPLSTNRRTIERVNVSVRCRRDAQLCAGRRYGTVRGLARTERFGRGPKRSEPAGTLCKNKRREWLLYVCNVFSACHKEIRNGRDDTPVGEYRAVSERRFRFVDEIWWPENDGRGVFSGKHNVNSIDLPTSEIVTVRKTACVFLSQRDVNDRSSQEIRDRPQSLFVFFSTNGNGSLQSDTRSFGSSTRLHG